MADIDLTKEIVKALEPNFLLAQEKLISDTDIARKIDTTSKTQAGINYIKKGIQKIYRSKSTPTVESTPTIESTPVPTRSKTHKWRNPFKSKNPKRSSSNFTIKNPAADPSYVQPAQFTGTSTSGGRRTTKKKNSNVSINSKRR